MEISDINELAKLQSIVKELGYPVTLLSKSEDIPIEMLSIASENDSKDRPRVITINVYPLGDELDDSTFFQIYFQGPFDVSGEARPLVLQEISKVNQELPLGHFNISVADNRVYFKYVLALPRGLEVQPLFLNDILDMCVFAQEHFLERVESVS